MRVIDKVEARGAQRSKSRIPLLLAMVGIVGGVDAGHPTKGKPLKTCQCGAGYSHSGYQCKECHEDRAK